MRGEDALAPMKWSWRGALCHHVGERTRQLTSEAETYGACIGLELGFLADHVVHHVPDEECGFEDPGNGSDDGDHAAPRKTECP